MKKNIYFPSVKYSCSLRKFSLGLLWLTLCFIPFSLYSATSDSEVDSTSQGIIYAYDGATIYQDDSNSTNKLVVITISKKTRIVENKKKVKTIAEEVKSQEFSKNLRIEKIQNDINSRIDFDYFSAQDLNYFSLNCSNANSKEFTILEPPIKLIAQLETSFQEISGFTTDWEKQKFRTLLPFIQLGKLRSLSLRAPPTLFT